MTTLELGRLALPDVLALPSQPLGPLQFVPLVRRHEVTNLPLAALTVDGGAASTGALALVPHGVVTGFDDARRPTVSYGAWLTDDRRMVAPPLAIPMGRREATARARMAPLHLALEGMLLSHFGVSPTVWSRLSQERVYDGATRTEGATASAMAAMLRAFELEAHQCGSLLYAADTLLAAFVAPSHDVYAALHRALVADLLAPTMVQYLRDADAVTRRFKATLPGRAVLTLDDLREALAASRQPWSVAEGALREGVSPSPLTTRGAEKSGPFVARRVVTSLGRSQGNAIGEVVHRADGAVAWLALHRLSDAQSRRAHLLAELAGAGWSTAQVLRLRGRDDESSLAQQIKNARFDDVMAAMAPTRAPAAAPDKPNRKGRTAR